MSLATNLNNICRECMYFHIVVHFGSTYIGWLNQNSESAWFYNEIELSMLVLWT